MAAEMAVESTVTEEIIQTMVKEEASAAATAREEASIQTDLADHSPRMVKEDHSVAKENHSAATDHADHSLRAVKEDHLSVVTESSLEREDHSEKTQKEEASAQTDHADHSLRVAKEGHLSVVTESSLEKEDHSATESRADSETLQRRASTEMTSTTSATRTRAESTR